MENPIDHFWWDRYAARLVAELERGGESYHSILHYVHDADRLTKRLTNRPAALFGDRPQDYLAAMLAVQSFRLIVAGTYLSLSGFAELVPSLSRTLWEIQMRLFDMTSDQAAAAIGFAIWSGREEVKFFEYRLTQVTRDDPREGDMRALLSWQSYVSRAEAHARTLGLEPEVVVSEHGRLNLRLVARKAGLESEYRTFYQNRSGFTHARDPALYGRIVAAGGAPQGVLIPLHVMQVDGLRDVIFNGLVALKLSLEVIGDEEGAKEAGDLAHGAEHLAVNMRRGEKPPGGEASKLEADSSDPTKQL